MDRIECRVDNEAYNNRDEGQRHQERDRRFAACEFVERKLSTARGNTKVTGYDVCHPSTPSLTSSAPAFGVSLGSELCPTIPRGTKASTASNLREPSISMRPIAGLVKRFTASGATGQQGHVT